MRASKVCLRTAPCNDYHVCSLVDAEFRPFASIGTRTAGNARQELVLLAPSSTVSTSRVEHAIQCPTDLIGLVVHHVQFSRDSAPAGTLPFCIEDHDGEPLVDFARVVDAVDAVARVEALPPEQYFFDALDALHETACVPTAAALQKALQKSFAAIAEAERASFASTGWTMIDHCVRDRTLEHRAAAVHAGYFSTKLHDVAELATRCDAAGAPLDSARTYCVRFARWNEPPAHASWFLHVAPAVPARVELERTDQATNITIGPSPPKDSVNWIETLPQPGPLEVRLTLCWPSERARSEIWMPPDVVAMN